MALCVFLLIAAVFFFASVKMLVLGHLLLSSLLFITVPYFISRSSETAAKLLKDDLKKDPEKIRQFLENGKLVLVSILLIFVPVWVITKYDAVLIIAINLVVIALTDHLVFIEFFSQDTYPPTPRH